MKRIYDRKNQKFYQEQQFGEGVLHFLYESFLGRILLKMAVNPWFSKFFAIYYDSSFSQRKIVPFVQKYHICMEEYEESSYRSFNDFFIRKKKKEYLDMKPDEGSLISPADSKLSVYFVTSDVKLSIKGHSYTLGELLRDEELSQFFRNGICLVFRLGVQDYHRYCHVASGKIVKEKKIKGLLHTVSSVSKNHKIFVENKREYQVVQTETMGMFVQMEIGALLVGEIVNRKKADVVQGEEKGYFSFGGSTVVILIPEKRVRLEDDILRNVLDGTEIKVNYAEKIGVIV